MGKVWGTCSNKVIPETFLLTSDIFSSHSPFLLLKRPFEINLQIVFQPSWVRIIEVTLTPSSKIKRAAGIKRGTFSTSIKLYFFRCLGVGGPKDSVRWRSETVCLIFSPYVCARTIPATELTSAIAIAFRPKKAPRSIYSSGCDAPCRKLKFDVIDSSENISV